MAYGIKYRMQFQSIKGENYTLLIEEKNYIGSEIYLSAANSPFTVDVDDDDFIYSPLRLSTAKITIVNKGMLNGLFSAEIHQLRVTLYNASDTPIWCGFVKPEVYSQNYISHNDSIEIECISAISSLEYVDYKMQGAEGKIFVTIKSCIEAAIISADPKSANVFIPSTLLSGSTASSPLLMDGNLTISEQNFFDEDGVAWKYKDVLEEICRFMHLTIDDSKGDIYFRDLDYDGEYIQYILTNGLLVDSGIRSVPKSVKVQDKGFAGSGQKIDLLGGYKKVFVKTSNYNSSDVMFPSEEISKDVTSYRRSSEIQIRTDDTHNYIVEEQIKIAEDLDCKIYALSSHDYTEEDGVKYAPMTETNFTDFTDGYSKNQYGVKTGGDIPYGAVPVRHAEYDMDDAPSDFSFSDMIYIRKWGYYNGHYFGVHFDEDGYLIKYKNHLPAIALSDGALALHFGIAFVQKVNSEYSYYLSSLKSDVYDKNTPVAKMSVQVGDKYWDGTKWTVVKSTFNVTASKPGYGAITALDNTKTLSMPYTSATGHIMPIPTDTVLSGEVIVKLIDLINPGGNTYENAVINDFGMDFVKSEVISTNTNTDRVYENIVNGDYINEMGEIEEKISSYNADGMSFSKLLIGDVYVKDNIYCTLTSANVRPEEYLLRRIINQYDAPKIKLTQVLMYDGTISPIDRLTDEAMAGKSFVPTGAEIDYAADSIELKMIEKA